MAKADILRFFTAFAVFAAMNGGVMADYDFEKAWKEVNTFAYKGLPRSVTNKVKEISREAIAVSRWPDAARAFLVREKMMGQFTDELPKNWLPAFAESVDAQPAPLQAVLQLHLAHTYVENSRRWRWGGTAPTKLDDEAAAEKMPPWSPEKIASTVETQLEKTFVHSDELKKQKVSEWNILFETGNVPESYCPTLFDFAVRDAIKFYGQTVPDKTLEKGIALYNKLMAFHREDGNVDALAMAEIDCAEYVRAFDRKPDKVRNALFAAFLDNFLKRYENKTDVTAIAAAKKADMMRGVECGDLVAPHALASRYAARYSKSIGGKMCANVIAKIESKELSIETERNWCTPLPDITVKARNVTEVHFRLVKVSFDDFVEDESMGSSGHGSDYLKDKYLKRKVAKEWKETIPLKHDFSTQTFSFPVPQGVPSGHYILYAAGNKKFGADKEPLFAQHVTVTSLALVLETGNGEFRGTVYRAESGLPVEGATVELWGYAKIGRIKKLREKYVTDADGRFTARIVIDNGLPINRNVRVIKDGEEVLSLKNEGAGWSHDEAPKFEHVEIFTDRSLYRPGQDIYLKGIAYHANPHTRDFHTLPNELVLVTLSDPNGKEVEAKRIRTNKWGSFVYKFVAPMDRLTGGYSIMARVVLGDGKIGEDKKTVNVEEYKRPKFLTRLKKSSDTATLGSQMTVTGCATSYSGLPVQKAKVTWNVSRTTRYPSWWSWFGGRNENDDGEGFVAQGESETDMSGEFKLTFTPVASPKADLDGDPSFDFTVTAIVTDQTGEAHSDSQSFEIGTVAWRANVWTEGSWHTTAEPVTAKVALKSLAGEPVPVKGRIKAFRLKAPGKPVRAPARRKDYYSDSTRDKKGAWDWKNWETGEEVFSLDIDSAKAEKWIGELKLGAGAYRLVFEATDPNGKKVKDLDNILVFDPSAKELGIAVPQFFQVERTNVKVGETLRAYWGTGYAEGYCRIKVTNNGKTILDKAVSGENPIWSYELPIEDCHRGEMRITTTFVRENRIYHEHDTINIPWDNKYLDITTEHLTSKLVPGGEETWKFKVSGPAEVLAFMYDKSLDAYKWHDVTLRISNYFTPWMRWLGSPSLENAIYDSRKLCGNFLSREQYYVKIQGPSWKRISSALVMRKAPRAAAAMGPAAAGMVCYEMACARAPAAEAEGIELDSISGAAPADSDGNERVADTPPRKNLKETAFFFPNLETDTDGRVSFSFTVPDALTGWKLLMVAHDNALGHGVLRNDEIVTTKPLMCEPAAPRFAREGDDFLFAVKVTNTEDAPQKGVVELKVGELESEGVGELVKGGGQSFELAPHESKTFEFRLSIPDGCGFLKYVAKANGTAFADGEEGILPVLSRRILVREAVQLNARGRETKAFRLDNLLKSKDSDTIRHHDLTVRAVSRPAWYAVLSLPYLMEFPHECCEQTFSRYYANALAEYIANADPRIRETFDAWKAAGGETLKSPLETDPRLKTIAIESTPWVREAKHEGAARARLGDLFGENRLAKEQSRCIEKLRMTKVGGLWPWFPGGYPSDGITLYILTGFARLNFLADKDYPEFFADSCVALDKRMSEYVKERLKKDRLPFHIDGFDIRWLYLHSFKGVAAAKDKLLVPLFVKHLREEWLDLSLSSQALAAIALKRMGEEKLAKEIMASIKERGVLSDELGMYWKVPYFFSSSVFAAPVSTQALIIEAFREVTGDEASAEACCVWMLKQKQTQDWTTTAATADAIYALLLGGGTDLLAGDTLAEVSLGGEKVKPAQVESGTGMYSVRFAAKDIRPEMGDVAFTGAGEKGVSWGGVHWSYFEDVLKVRAHEPKELSVEKKYYKKVTGPSGTRLTKIEGTLEPGDEIVARLEITSDRSYEFVHLSDERPACAEPEDVLSSYRWRDGVGYYQSTRDTATHYYIDRLNKGVFVLETSYRVRQRGTFVGGLAMIQCMYAPEFTAHSTAEIVRVKPAPLQGGQ